MQELLVMNILKQIPSINAHRDLWRGFKFFVLFCAIGMTLTARGFCTTPPPPGYIDASTYGPGWNATDATACLQEALDTGQNVWVPVEASHWIITPITLTCSNQELQFESGVEVDAKKGSFLGVNDDLFTGKNLNNVTIEGNGDTLKMNAADYEKPPYTDPGNRAALKFWSCSYMLIDNLKMISAGGAGIAFGQGGNPTNAYDTVSNCYCNSDDRNGISVLTADHLTITNSRFETNGPMAPGAGIDIEPDAANRQLSNISVNHCIFMNNKGGEIVLSLGSLISASPAVSISFDSDNCDDSVAGGFPDNAGIMVENIRPGTQGSVTFSNMTISVPDGTCPIDIKNKSADGLRVSYGIPSLNQPFGIITSRGSSNYPIYLEDTDDTDYGPFGGIDMYKFDFTSTFDEGGYFLYGLAGGDATAITDLQGSYYFETPSAATYYLTGPQSNVNVTIGQYPAPDGMAARIEAMNVMNLMRQMRK